MNWYWEKKTDKSLREQRVPRVWGSKGSCVSGVSVQVSVHTESTNTGVQTHSQEVCTHRNEMSLAPREGKLAILQGPDHRRFLEEEKQY